MGFLEYPLSVRFSLSVDDDFSMQRQTLGQYRYAGGGPQSLVASVNMVSLCVIICSSLTYGVSHTVITFLCQWMQEELFFICG